MLDPQLLRTRIDWVAERLLTPALIDAETGQLTAMRRMPWYAQALLLSQPLHFGDYGGLPLKIIWAALDGLTMIVIGSGLYLWLARRGKRARVRGVTPDNRVLLSSR